MVSGLSRLAEVEDLKCIHCGEKVLAPKYFDTRGQFYCDPDCWEGEDSTVYGAEELLIYFAP